MPLVISFVLHSLFCLHVARTESLTIAPQPKFHYKNPHSLVRETSAQRKERKELEAAGVPIVDAVSSGSRGSRYVGFEKPTPYASKPRTDYQRAMRPGALGASGAKVSFHYTREYSESVVEKLMNIPLRADADYKGARCIRGFYNCMSP